MVSTAIMAEQRPLDPACLPNKFVYPEFAGFAGEKYLKEILRQILPLALYRTWEIFVDHQAYGNDCFLSVERVAAKVQRAPKTIQANLAELVAKNLLELRGERKAFVEGERIYTRPVVVKDFSGLYTLAHEYAQWCQDPEYIEPMREYAALIKADPCLEAKLRRFNNYRRILYTQLTGPQAALTLQACWFQDYRTEENAKQEEAKEICSICPKKLPEKLSKKLPKVGQNESSEKVYKNNQERVSFDSAKPYKEWEGKKENLLAYNQNYEGGVQGYTKNPAPFSFKNEFESHTLTFDATVPLSVSKTCERDKKHPNMQDKQRAMVAAPVEDPQPRKSQPLKHPLACSFIHEVASVFGDLNEKGSKTGIERCIDTFELELAAVLLCLVRAYVVARDTKAEKIRHRRPETGAPNRMPLFCSMFKMFARALTSGSPWEYSWQQMQRDIAADGRLVLWLSENQALLPQASSHQETQFQEEPSEEAAQKSLAEEELGGWSDSVDAYEAGERLLLAIVEANYSGVAVTMREYAGRFYVVYKVEGDEIGELVLSTEKEVAFLIEQAQLGQL